MLFNSYVFVLLFLPIAMALWWGLARYGSCRLILLVAGSYLFYGWWDWRFTALLAFSTLIDYAMALVIERNDAVWRRRAAMAVSMIANLGLLGYFKYSGFMASSANALLEWMRYGGSLPVMDVVLPVGISFYTFQTLSYTVDVYRRQQTATHSILQFAAYVSMFPQLVAGPIVRYADVAVALQKLPERPCWETMWRGSRLFVIGMCQKVLLADSLAKVVTPLLIDTERLDMVGAWMALIGYSCQLYFDFAGYSNMAAGLGCFLGFEFPQNFDSPYQATDIQSFWRRWHITLSSWLRDYLYIPLGGNRHGKWLNARNLMIVMLIGGVWHGAGWTFVFWGAYHGILLVAYQAWRSYRTKPLPSFIGMAGTFLAVAWGWVLFRSTDLGMAARWYEALIGWHEVLSLGAAELGWSILVLAGALVVVFAVPNAWRMRWPMTRWSAALLGAALWLCILRFDSESPFLYFQF